jgi:threonine dehydratase
VKAQKPDVEVICIQPLGAPAMTHSWHQRRVVTTDSTHTIADGSNVDVDAYHRWVGAADRGGGRALWA